MAKDPGNRPQSPVDLHREIRACRESATRPEPKPVFIPLWAKISASFALDHSGRRLVAAAAAVGLLALGFTWLLSSQDEARNVAAETSALQSATPPSPEPQTSSAPAETAGDIPGLAAVASTEAFDEANPGVEHGTSPEEPAV